ncbi:MAG TPA: RNA polymerase sigma factor [Vicinamibacterales bacterium]|nr:RNA polymerase sigma factor [Vicinamibacterales bacterium]
MQASGRLLDAGSREPGSWKLSNTCTGALPLRSQSDEFAVRRGQDADSDVVRAAAGDVRAFEALYRQHLPRVSSLVRRMTGGRDSDELTQDVFVRVWQKLGSFRGDSAFSTWLHRLAVNVVIERFRAEATRRGRLHEGEEIFETISAPQRGGDWSMDFEAALMKLPGGAREIFVLHDVEGYKHQEIAALLGISAGTSKAQLHRARMMLRRHLNPPRPADQPSE